MNQTTNTTASIDLAQLDKLPRHHPNIPMGKMQACSDGDYYKVEDVQGLTRRSLTSGAPVAQTVLAADPDAQIAVEGFDYPTTYADLARIKPETLWNRYVCARPWPNAREAFLVARAIPFVRHEVIAAPAHDAAAPSAMISNQEAYTLRRLIECAEALDKRPRPMCRDCGDENGTCPNGDKLECDMGKLFSDAKRLYNRLAPAGAAAKTEQAECWSDAVPCNKCGAIGWHNCRPSSGAAGAGSAQPAALDERARDSFESYRIEQTKILGMPGLAARPSYIAGYRAALDQGAQAATTAGASEIKPWIRRLPDTIGQCNERQISAAKSEEIADLRAVLARAPLPAHPGQDGEKDAKGEQP